MWRYSCRGSLTLDRPRIIGILNVTPDSFSDGGQNASINDAMRAADRMASEGADMLDVGGESTRPGAHRVPADEQIRRVVPVIEAIRHSPGPLSDIPICVDTTLAAVARAALNAGADAINDVSAGTEDPAMVPLAAEFGAGLVLMHRTKAPPLDQYSDQYQVPPILDGALAVVIAFLDERSRAAIASGVACESLVLDLGLGFGKTVEQNLELVRGTRELVKLGFPVLSAASRKSFVGRVGLGQDSQPHERLLGTIALSVTHLAMGARLFRVHDVGAHAQALRVAEAIFRSAHEPGISTAFLAGGFSLSGRIAEQCRETTARVE